MNIFFKGNTVFNFFFSFEKFLVFFTINIFFQKKLKNLLKKKQKGTFFLYSLKKVFILQNNLFISWRVVSSQQP